MSTLGTDGTYRNENTVRFTGGSLRLVLDQTTSLPAGEAKQAGTQADKVMGRLVSTMFQVGSLISDYIEKYQVRQGSSCTEAANWQEVDKFHLRARLAISVDFAVPGSSSRGPPTRRCRTSAGSSPPRWTRPTRLIWPSRRSARPPRYSPTKRRWPT